MSVTTIVIIIVIIIVWCYFNNTEQFATKREKGKAIYDWFQDNKQPNYAQFSREISDVDLVEYESALSLSQRGRLTLDSITRSLI